MLRVAVPLLMMVVVAAAAPTRSDINGDWSSNWDDVRLARTGKYVHGTYVCCGGGTIDGVVYDERIIRYHWKQVNGGEGEGVWEIISSHRLEGTWGSGQSENDGGRWDLVRKPAIAN